MTLYRGKNLISPSQIVDGNLHLKPKSITENGIYLPRQDNVTGYSKVIVSVIDQEAGTDTFEAQLRLESIISSQPKENEGELINEAIANLENIITGEE